MRPEYRWHLDVPLLIGGAGSIVAGELMNTDRKVVPAEGLDPGDIHLGIDRDVVGNKDSNADQASDKVRDLSIAFAMLLPAASAPHGERTRATLHRIPLYLESVALSEGLTQILKRVTSRPRPFTYLPEAERPMNSQYDVEADRAFQSMPSGHATTSWCAVSFGITDHMLTRPEAGWKELALIGFSGGLCAATTSGLRVAAGQHFPTDDVVGSTIGIASGVTIPLVHRYLAAGARGPMPSGRSWLYAAAGTVIGIGAGHVIALATSP